jgi:release factor glutamine methyltransferase
MTDATWRVLRESAEQDLAGFGVGSPEAEARWIIEQASGYRGAELIACIDEPASSIASNDAARMVLERGQGTPLQYVLGSWSFRGLDLYVDRRVLIPRPETEITAEHAIEEAVRVGARRGRPRAFIDVPEYTVVDLGTGSGAIALAMTVELPEAEVWATDASADALAVARANLAGIGAAATRVRLAQGDWFEAVPAELKGRVRVIVTNPPYVATSEIDDLPPEVARHEPIDALVSGPTGLEAITHIVEEAPAWLEPAGALVVEIAPHQAEAAAAAARRAGFAEVGVEPDLTGRDRVLVARVH